MARTRKATFVISVIVVVFWEIVSCRHDKERPPNVPATAVKVGANYIDCIPHSSFVRQPCKVYEGSTGHVLESEPMAERLRSISSGRGSLPAVDCGIAATTNPDRKVAECGQGAFQKHRSFFALYRRDFADFIYAYGVAGDEEGNVFWMVYSTREFPSVPPTPRTQLLDENHTRLTPCIQPVKLATTEEGILACVTPVNEEASRRAIGQTPIDTAVCAIAENPTAFNNKLVRIRGHASGNFEYSMLSGDGCSDAIWFAYGSGDDSPPGLVAHIAGGAVPGAEDAEGRRILPIPVTLVRDANFDRFQRLMRARVEAEERAYRQNPDEFVSYQVTATFVGRIDGVSPDIHAFHRKRSDNADFLGFGHMGQFDAQFVMQSVRSDSVLEREAVVERRTK